MCALYIACFIRVFHNDGFCVSLFQDKTEYEYRTGNSGDYTYNYNAFGFDSEGNEVNGNITVNGKYGNGILTDKNGNEINIDTEWKGYGKLKAIDEEGNEYELEVDEQ